MSFCYLLNAALLFAGVLGFIVAGFAGTFARRLYGLRYRLMLAPLGFVVLGSIAHSLAARMVALYSHLHPAFHVTHPAGLGSGADVFETMMLLASGTAGVLCGIALGGSLDREPVSDATYTIANYWQRRSRSSQNASQPVPQAPGGVLPQPSRKENVVAISKGRKQQAAAIQIAAISETAISKTD